MLIQLFIIQLVVFAALLFMLRFLFYKHLDSALKRLNSLYQENLAKEAKIKKELEDVKEQKLSEISTGRAEAKKIVEDAVEKARNAQGEIESGARRQAEQILQRGKEEIERLKRNFSTNMENEALNLSIQMIKHTFTSEGKEALQKQFLNEIIKEIEKLDESKFAVKNRDVKIKSAYPLSAEEKDSLRKILSKKLNMDVKLELQTDEELMAGFVIQVETFIIDGSLKNRLEKVIPYLRKM